MQLSTAALALLNTAVGIKNVHVGESIQNAIDQADPGDVILVEPGIYKEQGDASGLYGLRVYKDDLTIVVNGPPGSFATLQPFNDAQRVGVYAAPQDCNDYGSPYCNATLLSNFFMEGFVVENFPKHGIQARWVDGFQFEQCTSKNNQDHGLIASYSKNGKISGSVSYGTRNSGIVVDASDSVQVNKNTVHDNPIGIEFIATTNSSIQCNDVYNNTVGVGVLHTSFGVGGEDKIKNEKLNVHVSHNTIHHNNLHNPGFPGQPQSLIPPGIGILEVGVKGVSVHDNDIFENNSTGVGMAGYCEVVQLMGSDCTKSPPTNGDPSANYNTVQENKLYNNGQQPSFPVYPNIDQLYLQNPQELFVNQEKDMNCFQENTNSAGQNATYFANKPGEALPTGGCQPIVTPAIRGGKLGHQAYCALLL